MAKFNQGNLDVVDGKTVDGVDVSRAEDILKRSQEKLAESYLRVNQSFRQLYYDDFSTTDKTNASYTGKVDTTQYKMTPGNGGTWRSKTITLSESSTVAKIWWKSGDGFDHDIKVSFDGGSNFTTVAFSGAETNKDKEVTIANVGTSMIIEVSNGTQGYLEYYEILVK